MLFCIRELAASLGISVRTLHEAVREVTGISPHRYVRSKRLSRARQKLLTGSTTSVKAAAHADVGNDRT
ncbi:helix-turn-helix domain-containing protein [Bradyrhizobium sp. Pa8]|uniref:helix-turn-helix domain-containing protein n=1 Tax=Bradyrhizobium sp. Pa8 TaxID=3386552 RepID=UPI00403F37E3